MTRVRILPPRSLFVIRIQTRERARSARIPALRVAAPRFFLPPLLVRLARDRQTDRQTQRERESERVCCALKTRTIININNEREGAFCLSRDTKRETRKSREWRLEEEERAEEGGYYFVQKIRPRAQRERERESDLIRDSILISRGRKRERERGARAVRIGNGARYPQRLRHHEHKV